MKHKRITAITFFLLGLIIISCLISIFNNDIYRDGAWTNAQWLGQDIITLFLAVPLLLTAFFKSIQQKQWKWKIILSGVLFYFVYTYAFYLFAAKLTFLYLFHLPIFGLALFALLFSLFDLFKQDLKLKSTSVLTKKIVITYLLFIASMLSFIWLVDIVSHLTIPGHQSDTPDGTAPLIIYSLDLTIVIPLMFIAAVAYWRKKQFGYILSGLMLTKTSLLGFALMAMSLSMYIQKLKPDTFLIILWCVIGLLGTVLTILYLRQLKKAI